jgi:hypothetical protein
MKTFKTLEAELAHHAERNAEALQRLHAEALECMTRKLDNGKALAAEFSRLEDSKELGADECGIYAWIRFDASDYIDTDSELEKTTFQSYLQENHSYSIDYMHDALQVYLGPCIVVNEDGDVLDQDSGKWIIGHQDYETESERNALIEAWMEKTDYFPSVVREDRHCNIFYVNTKEGAE